MARQKERVLFKHQPTTIEIFYCISSMPNWAKLLINEEPNKPYNNMLETLIKNNFYEGSADKRTIKTLSAELSIETTKVTKWVKAIYEDILLLNERKPQLFFGTGIPVTLYFKYFDNYGTIVLTIPVIPRKYERFNFYFMKAKLGTDYFWVERVDHAIGGEDYEITINLLGGIMNEYRDFLYEKAMFYNQISFMDAHSMTEYQIDEELRKIYKG